METINIGTGTNTGTGDSIRDAFIKANANFEELDNTKANKQESVFAISGLTPVIDPTDGDIQTWILTDNSSPTLSIGNGRSITLHIETSSFILTWPTGIAWVGDEPTLAETGINILTLWQVNGIVFGSYVGSVEIV